MADGLLERDVLAGRAREDFGDEERLREEALDLAGARDRELVFVGEFFHAEDGDDVLQILVLLEDGLHAARDLVMLFADDVRVEDAARGVQRIDRRINAELCDLARKDGRRIKMRERASRRRVGEVIGRDIDGLDGRDRAFLRGRDALLERADVRGERRLVADGRRHAAEEGRDFRACLDETEDVVDEQQDVLMLLVTEILSHRESRQGDAHRPRGRCPHGCARRRRRRRSSRRARSRCCG